MTDNRNAEERERQKCRMNTRKMLLCMVAVASAAIALAQGAAAPAGDAPHKRRGPHGRSKATRLIAPAQGPRVKVVDMQKRVGKAVIAAAQEDWRQMAWIHSDYVEGGTREEAMKDGNCGLAICLVDKPGADMLLVSPEGCWVEVNVGALAADGPTQEVFEKRFRREMWRAFAFGMGVGNETMPSLLNPITSLKELDGNEYDTPTPDAFNMMVFWAARRKLARVRYSSYRKACMEGWAPAPTNDEQRAVWAEVKADKERGPTNPITIAPPKK